MDISSGSNCIQIKKALKSVFLSLYQTNSKRFANKGAKEMIPYTDEIIETITKYLPKDELRLEVDILNETSNVCFIRAMLIYQF